MTNYIIKDGDKIVKVLVHAIAPAFAKLAVTSKSAAKLRQLMEDDRFKQTEAVMNNHALSEVEKNLRLIDITANFEERIKFCNLKTVFEKQNNIWAIPLTQQI